MTVTKICECAKPEPPTRANGTTAGNVCETCKGYIQTQWEKDRELGTLHVRVDAAITAVPKDVREDFVGHLSRTIGSQIAHTFKTWDHNRQVAARS